MHRLLEKSALLMLCLMGLTLGEDFTVPVIILLAACASTCLVQLFTGTRTASAIVAGGAVVCACVPGFFCVVPLVLYDALCEKKWWLAIPAAAAMFHAQMLEPRQGMVILAGIGIAVIIHMRVSGLETAVENLKMLRDEITEKNMQLAAQNRRLVQSQDNEVHIATLKERNRIAREIHDNVGHMLTRSILQIGAMQIINRDETLREPLRDLKATLDGAMTSIRTSVHDLHDTSIDLKKALTEMTAAVDKRFDVTLQYDAGAHIPGEIKLCIAGVVKEGISNAVKHSNGDRIAVILREHPAFYQLLIEDNGSVSTFSHSGIGLQNMESRAADVGGRMRITATEKGFSIFMTLPKER